MNPLINGEEKDMVKTHDKKHYANHFHTPILLIDADIVQRFRTS